jgi:hypothetical protein
MTDTGRSVAELVAQGLSNRDPGIGSRVDLARIMVQRLTPAKP